MIQKKIFKNYIVVLILAISLALFIPSIYYVQAQDSNNIGAIVGSPDNKQQQVIFINEKNSISSLESVSSKFSNLDSTENSSKLTNISNITSPDSKNQILEVVEKTIDFVLLRTGGQSITFSFSLVLILFGLLICISSFQQRDKK